VFDPESKIRGFAIRKRQSDSDRIWGLSAIW